ncbi:MAG: MmcB family DNA repair protein [Sphingopyxis sp.]
MDDAAPIPATIPGTDAMPVTGATGAAPATPPIFGAVCAGDVARGLMRLFHRQGMTSLCEVPLPNGRRADLLAICPRGRITIVEIKVAKADLLGDTKWPEYLDWCDHFYWGLSPTLDPEWISGEAWQPQRCGLIVADRYDAAILRPAAEHPLPPARRRSETLRLARLAMRRNMAAFDPDTQSYRIETDATG